MSGRDNDEHGSYPGEGARWRQDGSAEDPHNPSADTSALDFPVDLAAVQADDALLNLLSSGAGPAPGSTDAELARVLIAWRREVEAESFGDLVDPDTVTTVLAAARKPAPRRHPVLGPFAAAAAVLVIAFSGVGLVAKSAQPGDQLWSLTKVLYTDYARSVEAAEHVKAELVEADTAIRKGDTSQAKESLERIQQQLPEVNEDQNRTELAGQYRQLEERCRRAGPPTVPARGPIPQRRSAPRPWLRCRRCRRPHRPLPLRRHHRRPP
jgi:hypothetical protein